MQSELQNKVKCDVEVDFSDDPMANVFLYIGRTAEAIRRVHGISKAAEFTNEVNRAEDYEDAKRIIGEWVNVKW